MAIPCPLCASAETHEFLARDDVPVHQNVLYDTMEAARAVARGRLRMAVCAHCGFVFNAAFNPDLITYQRGYDNDQTFSSFFDSYIDALIERLRTQIGIEDRSIAEIGCGTGYFLDRVVSATARSVGVGYDPSYSGQAQSDDGRVSYIARHFSGDTRRADLVICRHVIEHIPRPAEFLAAVRDQLDGGADVVFETPALEWILEHQVIWDFFYEHCSLFSAAALARLFAASRFHVRSVEHVFNGQYLWLSASAVGAAEGGFSRSGETPPQIAESCRRFASAERVLRQRWQDAIASARGRGPLAVWGAGAKGTTFVNLLDAGADRIACVIDLNPRKQGRYIAGTGHPVVSPQELAPRGIATVMILNPNYEQEIRGAVADAQVVFVTP